MGLEVGKLFFQNHQESGGGSVGGAGATSRWMSPGFMASSTVSIKSHVS
jgi:hypothetical protein